MDEDVCFARLFSITIYIYNIIHSCLDVEK